MKTFKNLCLLFALMLGIAACSKEAQDAPQALEATRSEEGKSLHVGSRDSIVVNFTIGADSEELRLAQSVNAEGVPFNPFMEEKDVVIRFAVRKSNRVTYTDAVCKKIPGESKASYKGVIRLPDFSDRYANIPAEYRPPVDFTGHQIAGILLGEANGGTQFVEEIDANTVKTIEQTELLTAENDVVRSKVPYILDWMDFPLTTEGRQTNKLTLHFKPVGNLLRIQFNNQLNEAKTLQSFKVTSKAFVTQCKFEFNQLGRLTNNFQSYGNAMTSSGRPMETLARDHETQKTYTLSSPIHVAAKSKSKWYYLWVMPLQSTIRRGGEFSIIAEQPTKIIGQGNDGKDYILFNLCDPLDEGTNSLSCYFRGPSTIETAFKGGKLPLWYVADYNVAPGGTSLMNTHYIDQREGGYSNHGLFNSSERATISVPGYYLPRPFDFSTVVGSNFDAHNWIYRPVMFFGGLNGQSGDLMDETPQEGREIVRFPGETEAVEAKAIYIAKPGEIVYGLRFYHCGSSEKLTAYRYRLIDTHFMQRGTANNNARLEVTSMFLGSGFTGDIHTISNPSFWYSANSSNSVHKVFPVTGSTEDRRTAGGNMGTQTFYMGENETTLMLAPFNGFITSTFRDIEYRNPEIGHAVRLMKNEFKTAR